MTRLDASRLARTAALVLLALATLSCAEDSPTAWDDPRSFREVTAGPEHSCAIDTDHRVWCWGHMLNARLGFMSDRWPCDGEACFAPVPVVGGSGFVAIDAGWQHNCGIRDGGVACWGFDWKGQLGDADGTNQRCGERNPLRCSIEPIPAGLGVAVTEVTAGQSHSCAITADQRAYCWGHEEDGRLGTGLEGDFYDYNEVPMPVAGDHRFLAISAGFAHTCAIDVDRRAWCWGAGHSGQLGQGVPESSPLPVRVAGDTTSAVPAERESLEWAGIDAGVAHTCGVATAGETYCFGRGDRGALGDGRAVSSAVPVHVDVPGTPVVEVSTGEYHACALTEAGEIYCWGANEWGQLGDGGALDRWAPVPVEGGPAFIQVAAGARHTCALGEDRQVYCWGSGHWGQLGANHRASHGVPLPIGR